MEWLYCAISDQIYLYVNTDGYYYLYDGVELFKANPFHVYLKIKDGSAVFLD